MLNKIIVESTNDKFIFEHLLSIVKSGDSNLHDIQSIDNHSLEDLKSEIIDRIDFSQDILTLKMIKDLLNKKGVADIESIMQNQWFSLGGLSSSSIELKIKDLRRDILTAYEKPSISIIIDIDNHTIEERISFLNQAISSALNTDIDIHEVGAFKTFNITEDDSEYDFDLSYFFVGLNGKGEIEDILIELACTDIAYHAESLKNSWRPHLESNYEIILKDKDFNKLWIDFYKRYDCLTSKQKGNAGKYTQWDSFFKKHPTKFDFSRNIKELNQLKQFLSLILAGSSN